jgi:hypothetical protein
MIENQQCDSWIFVNIKCNIKYRLVELRDIMSIDENGMYF